MANLTDLIPVNRQEFATEVVPCLQLVAPVGMDQAAQRMWLNAAFKALDGIPIALLKQGAAAAMLQADHPSKIVPIIAKTVAEDWAWRKRQGHVRPSPAATVEPEPVVDDPVERAEVAELMSNLRRRLEANTAGAQA